MSHNIHVLDCVIMHTSHTSPALSLQLLCERCSELCNGAMVPGVADFTQKLAARMHTSMSAAPAAAGSDAGGVDVEHGHGDDGDAAVHVVEVHADSAGGAAPGVAAPAAVTFQVRRQQGMITPVQVPDKRSPRLCICNVCVCVY